MKSVLVFCNGNKITNFFPHARSFANYMHNEFRRLIKEKEDVNTLVENKYIASAYFIENLVKEEMGLAHIDDFLSSLFFQNITMDFCFAKDIQLYDTLSSECFYSKNEKGLALLNLVNYANVRFILAKRHYKSPDNLVLTFETCEQHYVEDLINAVKNGFTLEF